MMERRLQYNYAGIELDTGRCHSCMTTSYEIDDPAWIAVPKYSEQYVGKYYHDGNWYSDAEFTTPWAP